MELIFVVGKCLFTNSLIGATIQDGGKRERSEKDSICLSVSRIKQWF